MKKGFTLLELIIVIIIIGVLATLGITQYSRAIEKGRSAEAKSILGSLRSQQTAYYQDKGTYGSIADLGVGVPEGNTGMCNNTKYYFQYECDSGEGGTGECSAYRCQEGGKTPNCKDSLGQACTYQISLNVDGEWSGTAGYY